VLYGVLAGLAATDPSGRAGLLVLVGVLVAAVLVDRFLVSRGGAGTSVLDRVGLGRAGLGRPGRRALLVAAVLAGLIQLAYPITTGLTGAVPTLRPGWPWLLVGVFTLHGLAEELVWRGYAFARLRTGRRFGRAVALTMPLVAATHLPIVVSSGPAVGAAAMLVAAVTALPLARLYEMGRNSVWAPAVVHTGIDGFKLVELPGPVLPTFSLVLAAVSLLVPLLAMAVPRA
jgi:membrane protease YdiL (CAAX protease family)